MCVKDKIFLPLTVIVIIGTVYSSKTVAQSSSAIFSLEGRISDENGSPLSFAYVLIDSLKVGIIANANGHYQLDNIPAGSHKISVRSTGYRPQTIMVVIKNQSKKNIDFSLEEDIQALEEVIISGDTESNALRLSAKSVSVLETREVKLQTADLGEALTKVAGVNVRRGGGLGSNSRFSLNGLTDDQIRFFLNGIPLDFTGYSFGIANIPVNLIDRVEIYKGVVPVRFGADALGGAVNLVSNKSGDGTHGAFSYQVGSFGTHRIVLDFQHDFPESGLFVQSAAFFDAAKNNYRVDVEIPDESGQLSQVTVPRFHDTYRALGMNLEVGWRKKRWADQISLNVFLTNYARDIQHNNVMTIPYGEVASEVENLGGLLSWQKEWLSKLSADFIAGYSYTQTIFVDTSVFVYDWFGERLRNREGELRIRPSGGEISNLPSNRRVWDSNYYSRAVIDYTIGDQHQIRFSSAPTFVSRKGNERALPSSDAFDALSAQRDVFSFINGLEYVWTSRHQKIENIVFSKVYFQSLDAQEPVPGQVSGTQSRNRQTSDFGAGNSFRFRINQHWNIKASYEWATRLPRPQEIFGDAELIVDNLELEPERSNNVNLEFKFQTNKSTKSNWEMGLTWFLRHANNLIVLLGDEERFQYNNVFTAVSRGAEGVITWTSPNERFLIEANSTFQDFRNVSSKGAFGRFDGDRIPNRPYFFANSGASYRWSSVFKEQDEMSFFANARFVNEFFRGWESAGRRDTKQVIPSQFVQNTGLTHKVQLGELVTAITIEIQNVSNAKVFDFFGVQKPGRSYFFKMTTQF
ncbi:MAG: TonB-dependent receptor plug domain-containing protein [Bacteroidota bacterium]